MEEITDMDRVKWMLSLDDELGLFDDTIIIDKLRKKDVQWMMNQVYMYGIFERYLAYNEEYEFAQLALNQKLKYQKYYDYMSDKYCINVPINGDIMELEDKDLPLIIQFLLNDIKEEIDNQIIG